MSQQLSVILPIYNRAALLPHPLESLRSAGEAAPDLQWELLIINDASTESISNALASYGDLPIRLIHHSENLGLLAARLTGLQHAVGEAVCFLDADDAIAPSKFTRQLPALFEFHADLTTGSTSRRSLQPDGQPASPLRDDPPTPMSSHPAEFFLGIQPAPHDPIFRRSYLQSSVHPPLVAPNRIFDPIAETWFYYHLAHRPAKIHHVPGHHSIVGESETSRLSQKWERQCAAALTLMTAFQSKYPEDPDGTEAQRLLGRAAFSTYRALPNFFPPASLFLDLWKKSPPSPLPELGGTQFVRLAHVFGPLMASRLLKPLLRPRYSQAKTVSREELQKLFSAW